MDVTREWRRIQAALHDLQKEGWVALEQLPAATLPALQDRLRQPRPVHILHVVGHGHFDEQRQMGGLLLEDKQGSAQFVSPQNLGTLLYDHRSLRLAFLNACEGARANQYDLFTGMAQQLVQKGMPAVIAMQAPITDEAAITLSHEFYKALTANYPVDAALAEARKAIYGQGNRLEWGKPTLFMRTSEGHLFDVAEREMRPDYNATRQAYYGYLINEYKDHTIRGFAPQVGSRVLSLPLAKIFLPLQAVEGRPALAEYAEDDLRQALRETISEMDWQHRREETEKRLAQLSARQSVQRTLTLAELLKEPRAVLLGDPGTGKTTTTRYIAYALAANDTIHTGNSVRGLTPVLVRIANYAKAYEQDRTLHLIEYIEKELTSRPEFGPFLRHVIENGLCLIILDGLDEVANTSLRTEVTQRIQSMVATYSSNRFLVSSRIIGYDLSPLTREFKHATLQELTKDDRERFVSLWYEAIDSEITGSEHAGSANDLIDALRAKPPVARIAANPLLLTIIVLMHWRGVKLPSRRVQVYQNATDTLIEYWTAQRGVGELDAEEVKAVLGPIAYQILSSGVSGVIAHQDLLPRFYEGIVAQRGCSQQEAQKIGRALLKNISEQSGIFLERGQDANGQPVYGFLHQTFGEYLAALHLAQMLLNGEFVLADYIHRSAWYESLLLMAGHLSLISPNHNNTLLTDILHFPAPYEETLQRNLLLALDCLADDIQVRPGLRDEILTKLAQLLANPTPQLQEAAQTHFRHLAITRHREAAVYTLQQIYPLADQPQLNKQTEETRYQLAAALVGLKATALAQPIVWALDNKADSRNKLRIQRLRFEGWPQEASAYLLQQQASKRATFSVGAGRTLANCILGPVNAAAARRILGESEFLTLLDTLSNRLPAADDQATLRWMAAITPQSPATATLLALTVSTLPANIRRLAATWLLETAAHAQAVIILQQLVMEESSEAGEAAKALLDAGESVQWDWQLLVDLAFSANSDDAPQAIDNLLRAGQPAIGLSAALHLLVTCSCPDGRDRVMNLVMQSLIQHGYTAVGLAAAHWLALRPGYKHRLDACETLLEAGQVSETVPLLQILAYECHNNASQRVCSHLLKLREVTLITPLLLRMAQQSIPALKYQVSLALALAGDRITPIVDSALPPRDPLKIAVVVNRMQRYEAASANFITLAGRALDELPTGEADHQPATWLAKTCLAWLATMTDLRAQTHDNLDKQMGHPPTQLSPAISLALARLELRIGKWQQAQQRLHELMEQDEQALSAPVHTNLLALLKQLVMSNTLLYLLRVITHPMPIVRASAAEALGTLGNPAALPALLTALSDENETVRRAAAAALDTLGDPDALPALITALSDENETVRRAAASALDTLGDPAALPALITALSDENETVRRAAASALGTLGNPVALPAIIIALSDDVQTVRWSAISALGRLGEIAAIPTLLTALSDEDKNVRQSAAFALGRLGDLAIPIFLTALSNEDKIVRWPAAVALGTLGDPAALPALLTALTDEDKTVRRATAEALGNLGDPAALPALLTALIDDDKTVRWAATEALGSLGDLTALPALLTALTDEDQILRRSAASALGRLGNLAALPALLTALNDENQTVRWSAAQALGRLGDPTALPALLTALSDDAQAVRMHAAQALGSLGDIAAIPALFTALSDEEQTVRRHAAQALSNLGALTSTAGIFAFSAVGYSWDAQGFATALIHLDPAKALLALARYTSQFPREQWESLCGQALWQLGRTEESLLCLRKAVEQETASNNLLALAHFHLEHNDLEMAQAVADQALEKAEKWGKALCQLSQAVILWLMDKQELALAALQVAQKQDRTITHRRDLEYDHFWRAQALAALDALLAYQQMQKQ